MCKQHVFYMLKFASNSIERRTHWDVSDRAALWKAKWAKNGMVGLEWNGMEGFGCMCLNVNCDPLHLYFYQTSPHLSLVQLTLLSILRTAPSSHIPQTWAPSNYDWSTTSIGLDLVAMSSLDSDSYQISMKSNALIIHSIVEWFWFDLNASWFFQAAVRTDLGHPTHRTKRQDVQWAPQQDRRHRKAHH